MNLEEMEKTIKELKKQIIRAWEVITHNKEECMENRTIREVLREFFEEEKQNTSSEVFIAFLDGLLAKLDVRSAAHTEEHDCYKEWTKNIKVHNLDELIPKTEKKDSGGEKEFTMKELNEFADEQISHQESHYDHKTDSKPPKSPFYECVKCNSIHHSLALNQDDEGYNICPDCGSRVFKTPIEDRLPGGTGTEPREDSYTCRLCGNEITLVEYEVSKLTVEVKREDLQFLYALARNDTLKLDKEDLHEKRMKYLHKIKEEYSL